MKMINSSVKYEVFVKQYLHAILDISDFLLDMIFIKAWEKPVLYEYMVKNIYIRYGSTNK